MPLSESDCAAKYKILVLGDASVGKSSLLKCLIGKEFRESVLPTVATDFVGKRLEVDGALVELQIWDTAGQERFHSMNKWQYKGVKGVALVYDVTDRKSFTSLTYWLHSINNEISSLDKYETAPVVLLGNKCDLGTDRKVQLQEGKKLAEKELAFDFFETSARTGENVFNAFRKLASVVTEICNPEIMKSYHPNMIKESQVPTLPETTRTIKFCSIVIVQWTMKKRYLASEKKSKRKNKKTENPKTNRGKVKCCCIL